MRSCVVTGSYDPVTLGHIDLIRAAAGMFDHVVAAVLDSTAKQYMFTAGEREEMLRASCADIKGSSVEVVGWTGLLVNLLEQKSIDFIVRGIRDARDVDYERQMAAVNAKLRPGTQTIWLSAKEDHWAISSTIVRELLANGADIAPFVPPGALEWIRHRDSKGGAQDGAESI